MTSIGNGILELSNTGLLWNAVVLPENLQV
jgi:hypothetical protein